MTTAPQPPQWGDNITPMLDAMRGVASAEPGSVRELRMLLAEWRDWYAGASEWHRDLQQRTDAALARITLEDAE